MHYRLGAHRAGAGAFSFHVWAPLAKSLDLVIYEGEDDKLRRLPMEAGEHGYFSLVTEEASEGTLYEYAFADNMVPDPASLLQPFGVHGPSQCVDLQPLDAEPQPAVTLSDAVIYELHVGTFTRQGTLSAAAAELPRLAELGVTMIELMPLGEFPGRRNWGYDGVFPFSVHHAYGGPKALQDFVRVAHQTGLGVMLDVVYNHLGPEGNNLRAFGPYFNERVLTPWGPSINFDGAHSDEVRRFFGSSAEQWVSDFDIDGLRFDAAHEIADRSATPFLASLTDALHMRAAARGKQLMLVAESDANDPRYVTPTSALGFGFDAMWCDDLHHALHVALTGEKDGYYADFQGLEHLARAWRLGSTYDGQYAPSRKRRHGHTFAGLEAPSIVVCSQNHDQVGNRARGERLTALAGTKAQQLAAIVVLLSPYTPLLFMGEEYGELTPFQYFVDHGDEELIDAVRNGRRAEFAHFGWADDVPDPQSAKTHEASCIAPQLAGTPKHAGVLATYRELLKLRREQAAHGQVRDATVIEGSRVLCLSRGPAAETVAYVNFDRKPAKLTATHTGRYSARLDLGDPSFGGDGSLAPKEISRGAALDLPGFSAVIYCRTS